MMQAYSAPFILVGATEEDITAVVAAFGSYQVEKDYEPGKTRIIRQVPGTDLEDPVLIDLREDGRVVFDGSVTIYYQDTESRNVLLRQLVQMYSGERIVDCGLEELYLLARKGKTFRFVYNHIDFDEAKNNSAGVAFMKEHVSNNDSFILQAEYMVDGESVLMDFNNFIDVVNDNFDFSGETCYSVIYEEDACNRITYSLFIAYD